MGRKNTNLQLKTRMTVVSKQNFSSKDLLLPVMLCSALRRALWKSTKTKKCYSNVCQKNCHRFFCQACIKFSEVFLESSRKKFQNCFTYVYSRSTSNSTLLSLRKTARKFTKASRMFESEF